MKWEYQFKDVDSTDPARSNADLTALGQEGWEAVGVAPYYWEVSGSISEGEGDISSTRASIVVLLKRPLPN